MLLLLGVGGRCVKLERRLLSLAASYHATQDAPPSQAPRLTSSKKLLLPPPCSFFKYIFSILLPLTYSSSKFGAPRVRRVWLRRIGSNDWNFSQFFSPVYQHVALQPQIEDRFQQINLS